MSRRMSRITQDEVARIIRAAQSCGLSIGGVAFDGDSVKVLTNIGDIEEKPRSPARHQNSEDTPIREPQL